jgi:type II secretory pathway pseudopilin PulG
MKAKLIYNNSSQAGFSTLEILVAFMLMVLSITAVILLIFTSQSLAVDAATNAEGLQKARSMLEDARATAVQDFNAVNPLPVPPARFIADNIYKKSLDVTMVDSYTKKVTGTVSWPAEGGRTSSVQLTSVLTNPKGYLNGYTCNSVLHNPTGWKSPHAYTWDLGQLGVNGNNGTGFGVSYVYVYKNRLYATMYDSPNTDTDNFFIFDLPNDPSQPPVFRGSVDNAPTIGSAGLNSVAVGGAYAYVTSAYAAPSSCSNPAGTNKNCGQMQVVDVSDPTLPLASNPVKYTYKVPSYTAGNTLAPGISIFYKDGIVYLGLAKSVTGPEFISIDVGGGGTPGASPVTPKPLGSYEVGNGINSIYINGSYAYITSANNEAVTILDVSSPASPTLPRLGGYTPSNLPESNGVGSNHGESAYPVGNKLYLGRTYGTNELSVLDTTIPGNIVLLGNKDVGAGNKTSVYGLVVRDYLAFDITLNQFQVWNVANPASIQPWSADSTANSFLSFVSMGGTGTALYCSGDYFYVAIASSGGVRKDLIAVITPGP